MMLTSKMAGVYSTAITGDGKDRLEVVCESVDVVCLINCLRKKVGRADIIRVPEVKEKPPMSISQVENTDSDHLTTDVARSGVNSELTMFARGNGMAHGPSSRLQDFNFSELEAITHYFSEENIRVGDDPSLLEKILTPRAMDEDNQRFNYPFSGSSSDSEESPSSSLRPASFKGKGKQTLLVAQPHHQDVRPHVAVSAWPEGPSPSGIMAHLRAVAAGLKASRLAVHEWLVPIVPAYGIIFVFVFLLFLRIVTSRNF